MEKQVSSTGCTNWFHEQIGSSFQSGSVLGGGGAPHIIIQSKSFKFAFKSFGWSVPDVPGRMSSTRARLRRSMKIVRGRLGIAVCC